MKKCAYCEEPCRGKFCCTRCRKSFLLVRLYQAAEALKKYRASPLSDSHMRDWNEAELVVEEAR